MKKRVRAGINTMALMLLVALLLSPVACKKEEPQSERIPAQAYNPYTTDSVLGEVKQKLEKNPDDVDALFHLADLYERNGQYPEAIETYKHLIKVKPGAGYAYFKMGTAYDRINKPAEAIEAFKKSVQYMPKHAMTYNNMGVAYGKLNKYQDEIAALKKAIQLRPSYSTARFNLGVTYLKIGNKKAAQQEYESLMKFDEGAAEALMKEIKKGS
ncbi:MAG TPA: tetratricopeptide repeat protein [Thermodesulfovibrionales bacterium]|nr:tetratricopeptide repeat protein [Thermodesulfovibrionales bacterium]